MLNTYFVMNWTKNIPNWFIAQVKQKLIVNKKINPGSNINLGSFSKGNYIIQVKDKTGRMITRQKLVKE